VAEPQRSAFLTARWLDLAIANYAVDPIVLEPHLPYGTELDLWQGTCYVSLVGFLFNDTRLRGIPIPWHRDFEEVNLRFYVKREEGGTVKRGVVFVKEIVPRAALTFMANTMYGEHYRTMPMRHAVDRSNGRGVSYGWKSGRGWNTIEVDGVDTPLEIPTGSEEEFITEHYWGYTRLGADRTGEYAVEHPRWRTFPLRSYRIDADFGGLYGQEFASLTRETPRSAMLAEGSTVLVRGRRIIR
jgi:uncharacterized protein YqjF (DUF2071 family)